MQPTKHDPKIVAALCEVLGTDEIKVVSEYDVDGKPSFVRGYRTTGDGDALSYVCFNAKAQECHMPVARVQAVLDSAPAKPVAK